jgi:hypothetical protein
LDRLRSLAPGDADPGAAKGWLLMKSDATVERVSRSLLILVGLVVSLSAGRVASAQSCPADCSGDNQVGVNELITCVNIVLASGPTTSCPPCDGNGDGTVAINEIIAGVNSALEGCAVVVGPDLAPVSARFRSMTPACITDTSQIQIRLEVCVANQGTVASGPFNIEVLGEPSAA